MKLLRIFTLLAVVIFLTSPLSAQHYKGQTVIGISGSINKLVGDDKDQSMINPSVGLKLGYTFIPEFQVNLYGGYGIEYPNDPSEDAPAKHWSKYPDTPFKTILMPLLLDLQVNFKPDSRFNPYFIWGWGILVWDMENDGESMYDNQKNALSDWGIGFDYFLSETWSLDASLHYQHILNQNKDMSGYGDKQSGNIEARVGLNLYLGGNKDKDGDGIPDKLDKCPDKPEDIDGFQDADGCPDPDNDGDGILDLVDQAPNKAEDMDGFQDEDGAPDLDNDNDGIPDAQDKCPDEPETVNGFKDEDGCPDKKPEIVIEKSAAPIVLEGVTFESGKATLAEESKSVLDKVVQTLVDYPEMTLEVGGYTDSAGSRKFNVNLSQQRADAVKAYLVEKGIAEERITSVGYGPDNPIAPNDTNEGKAKNRRIEFKRTD